ncbi:MAG: TIGR03009 domain-containing protein [Pirellulales bacterium]|nr:TIGR03009 domain-containing protein [Pirellulales bacterium]
MARLGVLTAAIICVLLLAAGVCGQDQPWRAGAGPARPAGPAAQPMGPQPTVQQPAPQAFAQPPFVLNAQQQAYVDRWLAAWEARSNGIKTFETPFTRYEYDPVFGPPDAPRYKDTGTLKYKNPDQGYFRVDGPREELWICDGESIFQFDYTAKKRTEYPLDPAMQGQAIKDGPLPFLFGAKAEELKKRYWIRAVAPPEDKRETEVWLQAYPRHPRDAANFCRAEMILDAKTVLPKAVQLHDPNRKNRTVYTFEKMVLNHANPLQFLTGDPFKANSHTPFGWEKIVERPATAQTAAPPTPGAMR